MSLLGVIPARYASTRFPGKPLALIGEKTMIQHVWDRCSLSQHIASWIVATDDERIFKHVQDFGGKALMTSPTAESGTDRCAEVLLKNHEHFSGVINVQGDEPLVDITQIDSLALIIEKGQCDIATLVKWNTSWEDFQNPNRVKCVRNINGEAIYFSRSPIPHHSNPGTFKGFYKHLGMYGYTRNFLEKLSSLKFSSLEIVESLEQLRWLDNGFKLLTIETQAETPSVDTPEDLAQILKHF